MFGKFVVVACRAIYAIVGATALLTRQRGTRYQEACRMQIGRFVAAPRAGVGNFRRKAFEDFDRLLHSASNSYWTKMFAHRVANLRDQVFSPSVDGAILRCGFLVNACSTA